MTEALALDFWIASTLARMGLFVLCFWARRPRSSNLQNESRGETVGSLKDESSRTRGAQSGMGTILAFESLARL